MFSEDRVGEGLLLACGGEVEVLLGVEEAEVRGEDLRERGGVVTADRKVAATIRTLEAEGSQDEVSACEDALLGEMDVAFLIVGVGEEVKDRAVMPYLEGAKGSGIEDVPNQECDLRGLPRGKLAGQGMQGLGGEIDHGTLREAVGDKLWDEQGTTASDIDKIAPRSGIRSNEAQGDVWLHLVPTEGVHGFAGVDTIPVLPVGLMHVSSSKAGYCALKSTVMGSVLGG